MEKQNLKIQALSFVDAAVYSCLKDISPTIIISVDDWGFPETPLDYSNPNIAAVLKLHFADTDDYENELAMSEDEARRIVSFVEKWLPIHPDIIVHCAAGRSRSAGIVCALDLWLNGDTESLWASPYKTPNPLCFEKVCRAAGMEVDHDETMRRYEHSRENFGAYHRGGYEDKLLECCARGNMDGEVREYSDNDPEGREAQAWEDIIDRLGDDSPLAEGAVSLYKRRNKNRSDEWNHS